MPVKDTYKTRAEIIVLLVERDGAVCMHPDCGRPIDLSLPEHPLQATIDHREPQSWCREQGWTDAQIWDMSNLDLMHKKCNADKGHRRYLPDGTLEPKPLSRFRYRRQKRAERPEICTSCNAGRDLQDDDVCASCGSGPMPLRWPRWRKMSSRDCDHHLFWCGMCGSGLIERTGATEMIILGSEGGDEDEAGE